MATIDKNQYDYLTNLSKQGGGNAEWAKAQLASSTYNPTPITSAQQPSPTLTPSLTTTKQTFNTPKIVGSTTGSTDTHGTLANIGMQQLQGKPLGTQFNTWTDTKTGTVYDTSGMTPQQAYALELNVTNNPRKDQILKTMGLDINGNPTGPVTKPNFPAVGGVGAGVGLAGLGMPGGLPSGGFAGGAGAIQGGGVPTAQGANNGVGQGGALPLSGDAAMRKEIEDQIMARLRGEELAINQGVESANQGFGLAQAKNQNALQEQIARFNKQRAVERQGAQDLQNRRGGFYSGGLDYQLGGIDSSINEGIGGVERDISARNADIASKIAMNKQQAADRIAQLRGAAPAEIQAKLSAALSARAEAQAKAQQQAFENSLKSRDADVKEAGVTGYWNDREKVDRVKQQMAENSQAWFNASPEERTRLHEENLKLAASIGGEDVTGSGDYAFGPGNPTLSREKQDYEIASAEDKKVYDRAYQNARDMIADAKWQAKFDQDAEQFGITTAIDNAYKAGMLSVAERNAATSEANAATSRFSAETSAAREDRLSKEGSSGSTKVDKNEIEAQYIEGFDSIPVANRKAAFEGEKGAIIRDLGKAGYDALYKTYFDEYGDPK